MISIWPILSLFVFHYIFDWVIQTRYVAENKSKSNVVLADHVIFYTIGLSIFAIIFGIPFWWVIVNGFLHFGVDWITSRLSAKFYKNERLKAFWNNIGADQMIHYLILFGTLALT